MNLKIRCGCWLCDKPIYESDEVSQYVAHTIHSSCMSNPTVLQTESLTRGKSFSDKLVTFKRLLALNKKQIA